MVHMLTSIFDKRLKPLNCVKSDAPPLIECLKLAMKLLHIAH
jgi:hypothetical protein